jgi:plasmid maintenance system antidote protein VapI
MPRQDLTSRRLKTYTKEYLEKTGVSINTLAGNISVNCARLNNFVNGNGTVSAYEIDQLCKLLNLELVQR